MKRCIFYNCKNEVTKELDSNPLCEYHYKTLKYEKDFKERQKKRWKHKPWLFQRGPDHQFYVKGIGMVSRKQSNLENILFSLAFLLFWIIIPILLIFTIIFKWKW